MRITSLFLKNIGVFEDEEIEFKPCPAKDKAEIHIFTGINGSGKSTLLKALVAAFEATGVSTNSDDEQICNKDTNSLSKYLRTKNQLSGGTVCFDVENKKHCIMYYGCPNGANHLHIKSADHSEVAHHRIAQTQQERPEYSFPMALFAYSGYRLLDFKPDNTGVYNENPLYQALEFIKKPNPAFSIDKWIKDSLLKRSYARTEGLSTKEHNYTDTIQKIETILSEILGFKVQFKLDKNLRQPVIIYNETEHDFAVLPDGLKSVISWLADLCMRLEGLDWVGDIPVFDRNIILFLDEIEVHLHIEWQRKILPIVQKIFPKAQIFISTHSPFVVNSIDDAWVYNLTVDNQNAKVEKVTLSQDGHSIRYVLRTVFGITQMFGFAVEKDLDQFYQYRDKALALTITKEEENQMIALAKSIASQGLELESIIGMEMRQIKQQTKTTYEI